MTNDSLIDRLDAAMIPYLPANTTVGARRMAAIAASKIIRQHQQAPLLKVDIVKRLNSWLSHNGNCPKANRYPREQCTCGLDDAIAAMSQPVTDKL